MTNITGNRLITITASAGEIYDIDYITAYAVDVANNTDSDILISDNNDFVQSSGAGNYATIVSGGAYNGMALVNSKLYIKSNGSGNIAIVRSR